MAYGTINSPIINHYNKIEYTLDRKTYSDIHVFKTDPDSETVSPAVCTTGSKKTLSNMNPNGIAASKVMAKTNGNTMEYYSEQGDAFYGFFYANGQLYQHGEAITAGAGGYGFRGYPALCLKTDGSAVIRWFLSSYALSQALPYCNSIISGSAPLVYNRKAVFATETDSSDGYTILNPNDYYDESCHYNRTHCGGRETTNTGRTFLGHKPDGSYLMVVCESMSLVNGSKLMADLGCDYAINLDGAGASQMRVSSQYLNNVSGVSAGKVTTTGSNGTYYGTAVIAHSN